MKIAIASDHGGYELKEELKKYLAERGDIEVLDLGTDSEDSVDYPDYGVKCGEAVADGRAERGVVCCGTGIGISIACNKIKGIRCAHCSETYSAEFSRRHNDANVVAFGARVVGEEIAFQIADTFLKTPFEGGRHQRRVDKINKLDER